MEWVTLGNRIEAALWFFIALALAAYRPHGTRAGRRLPWRAAGWFTLFGLSDVIESFTGAWWEPWWLLALKGACITGLAHTYRAYRSQPHK